MPVQKVPNSWGDMLNLKPAAFGTSDIPPDPVPPNFGIPDPNSPKAYNWQQWLIDLKDVPIPAHPADVGKSLVFRPNMEVDGETLYTVSWEIPANSETADRLTNPRNFSITGDGEAPAVAFDGTADVVLELTNLVANKWKTPRAITFTGTDATGSVSLDGSADVSVALNVLNSDNAASAAQAAKWTTPRTLTISGNATGTSSAWDGSGNATLVLTVNQAANATNAVNATNATNAVNATNATNAATASKVAAGGLTVTLTGGATGAGSSDAAGNVTIATTVAGSGGGTGAGGQTEFGNSTQYWGRGITGAGGDLVINFPVPFLSNNGYAIVASPEVDGSVTTAVSIAIIARSTTSVTLRALAAGAPQISLNLNYVIVGQTTP